MSSLLSFEREFYGIESSMIGGLYVDEILPAKDVFPVPPKILLLHGAAGSSVTYFPLMSLLSKQGYHIVAPNLPGHGKNPPIPMKNLHVWDYMEPLRQLCDIIQPDILAGHSMGSFLIQKMALEYPAKAVILMSAVPPLGVPWKMDKAFIRYFFSILYAIPYFLGFPGPLNHIFNKHFIYTHTPRATLASLSQALEKDSHPGKETPHLYFDFFKEFGRISPSKNSYPILICTGEMDPLMTLESQEAIARHYNHCKVYVQPNSGHLFPIEEGIEQTSEQIHQFLAELFL